jgi:hypothetical protein
MFRKYASTKQIGKFFGPPAAVTEKRLLLSQVDCLRPFFAKPENAIRQK